MKLLPAVLAAFLILSLPALAQRDDHHDGNDHHRDFGGGYVPRHGPPAYHGNPHDADRHDGARHDDGDKRSYRDRDDHPEAPTFIATASGSDTTVGAKTPASTSIIPGSMAGLKADSAADTAGALKVAILAGSGFTASPSASPPLTWPTATIGIGTAMTS